MKTLILILLALAISNTTLKAEPLSGQARIDSLLAELPKAKGDTNEVMLLNALSFYYNAFDTDVGLKYGFDGVNLANTLNWKVGIGACYNSIGFNYKELKNYDKAIEYFNKALVINKKLNIKGELIFNYMNLATVQSIQSNHLEAIDNLKKGLEISKQLKSNAKISRFLVGIGSVHINLSNYPIALEYFHEALLINQKLNNKKTSAFVLGRIGQIHLSLLNFEKSLYYYQKALKLNVEVGNKHFEAYNIGNIGILYFDQSDYQTALKYYNKALKKYQELKNKQEISVYLGNIGSVYKKLKEYDKSSEYYQRAINMNLETNRKSGLAHNYNDYGEMILNLYNESNIEIRNKKSNLFNLSKNELLNRAIEYLEKSNKLFIKTGFALEMSKNYNNLHNAYFEKRKFKESTIALRKFNKIQDSIFSKKNIAKITALENKRLEDLNLAKLEKQKVIIAAQEKEKEFIVFSASGGILSILLILGLIIKQRKISDKLLYNVLPVSIAKRLKKKEHPISDYFTQASIIFIDIVGFTSMSQDADPRNIVIELNKIFTKYDAIANKYGLEKIKTIGDSYMAAAGIPEVQKDNTHRAAQMALEVKAMMEDYNTADGTKIEVRIGLDCGPVVAGVIGENKFIYDMWSDAVNTASRMESSSIAGEVHVSERFKEAVTEYEQFDYVERGEIEIKGKGKMKTFFMGSKKLEV